MGCGCNKQTKNWKNIQWVIDKAQKIADIKQSNQVIYQYEGSFMFNDEDTFRGDKIEQLIKPQQRYLS